MRSIAYKALINSINDKELIIDEKNYTYDEIIRSIYKIKLLSKIFKVKVNIVEKEKRDINSLSDIATVINMKDKREKISFIYDRMCDYLDYEFIHKNKCVFIKNKCVSDRNKDYEKNCGCCRSKDGNLCKYLIKKFGM